MPANNRIISDSFDPAKRDRGIAWAGDRDLGSHELRKLGFIEDQKLAALGGATFVEGFVTAGLAPTVRTITNQLAWSNRFDLWSAANGAVVVPAAANDRYGNLAATRLAGVVGQDSYIEGTVAGSPAGQQVFAVDAKIDATAALAVAWYDGVTEIASMTFTLTNAWTRPAFPNAVWSPGATAIKIRLRPGPGQQPGSVFIARAQVEAGTATPGQYIETAGGPATGPGNVVDFTAGAAYVAGLPRAFAAQTITFDPLVASGLATVYGEYAERYMVGYYTRPELDNPVTGNPGNDAVREETQLVTTDTTNPAVALDPNPADPQYRSRKAVPVYQFDRATGAVLPIAPTTLVDLGKTVGLLPGPRIAVQSIPEDRLDLTATEGQPGLLAALARRLADQSGNFVVTRTGDAPSITQDTTVVSQVALRVNPLDGFTSGRAFYLDRPADLTTPLQNTTGTRANESHTYYVGVDTYQLARSPVVAIDQLVGIFEVTRAIVRGLVPGGADQLPDTPVFQIVSVTQGPTTYQVGPGLDCIQNGDTVDWSPPGAEPVAGSTYTVVYRFSRVWPANEFTFNSTSITFTGANRPVPTLPFTVQYNYGLDRVDLVYLQGQQLVVAQGTPSDHPTPPVVPDGAMALWNVNVGYLASSVTFEPRFTPGASMAQIADIVRKIGDIQYDLAVISSNIDLRDRQTSLKGIIVDPWSDYRQFDTNAAFFSTPGTLRAVIDTVRGRLVMAQNTTQQRLAVDTTNGRTTMQQAGPAWAGLPSTPLVLDQQGAYTTTVPVNPSGNLGAVPPTILLSSQGWDVTPFVDQPGIEVTITGFGMGPNEANIAITVDGVAAGTANADAHGVFTFTLTHAFHRNSVVKALSVRGSAAAVFSLPTQWTGGTGIAQNIVAPQGADLLSVDLTFTAKSLSAPLVAMLRPVGVGTPTPDILAAVVLPPTSVVTTGGVTTITFPQPVTLSPGAKYALVLAASDGAYQVEAAVLGQLDHISAAIVTAPPYPQGDFWTQAAAGAPLVRQANTALRMVLRAASYQAAGTLATVEADYPGGITRVGLLASYAVAAGTGLVWSYSVDAPTVPDNQRLWVAFDPAGGPVDLGLVANYIRFRAVATGSGGHPLAGVRVNAENLVIVASLAAFTSTYVSVETVLFQNTSGIKAYVQSYNKTGADAKPYASNDGGVTWVAGTLAATRQLTTDLAEYEFDITFGSPGNQFRGRVDLETSSPTVLPEGEQVSWVIQ